MTCDEIPRAGKPISSMLPYKIRGIPKCRHYNICIGVILKLYWSQEACAQEHPLVRGSACTCVHDDENDRGACPSFVYIHGKPYHGYRILKVFEQAEIEGRKALYHVIIIASQPLTSGRDCNTCIM
jgi:hypothetical protein